MNERTLPWSPDAEREILGAPFIDPRVLDRLAGLVDVSDFYHAGHAAIWQCMIEVWREAETLDFVLLRERLKDRQILDRVGGDQKLGELLNRVGTTSNVEHYAGIVSRKARLRAVIEAARDIVEEGFGDVEDVDGFAARAEVAIRRAIERGTGSRLIKADVGAPAALERFCRIKDPNDADAERFRGIPTGFTEFDKWTGGLQRKLTICAGRPSMGKSAWGLSVVLECALAGRPCFVWSGEMPEWEVFGRWIAMLSGIPFLALTSTYALAGDDLRKASDATCKLAELPIEIDCDTGLTADQIVARMIRSRTELGGLDVAMVDHFGLMRHPVVGRERNDESMGRSSGRLRDAVKDLEAAGLLLVQLNREPTKRPDKRPILEDLRECGRLEEDAHAVVFPFRPVVYDKLADKRDAELIVAKNRSGPTGTLPLRFRPGPIRFYEPTI